MFDCAGVKERGVAVIKLPRYTDLVLPALWLYSSDKIFYTTHYTLHTTHYTLHTLNVEQIPWNPSLRRSLSGEIICLCS